MNETDSSKPESNFNPDEWKTSSPDIFLTILLPELRTSLTVIKGYTEILADEKMKVHHPQALEIISKKLETMMKLCDDIAEYRNELIGRNNT